MTEGIRQCQPKMPQICPESRVEPHPVYIQGFTNSLMINIPAMNFCSIIFCCFLVVVMLGFYWVSSMIFRLRQFDFRSSCRFHVMGRSNSQRLIWLEVPWEIPNTKHIYRHALSWKSNLPTNMKMVVACFFSKQPDSGFDWITNPNSKLCGKRVHE